MLALVLPSLARSCMAMKLGIAIAARMPMITTTIISSIRVKPFSFRVIRHAPCAEDRERNPESDHATTVPEAGDGCLASGGHDTTRTSLRRAGGRYQREVPGRPQ